MRLHFTYILVLVTKLMSRVANVAGVKLAQRSIIHNTSWSSGDEMAIEASEHEEYLGGACRECILD